MTMSYASAFRNGYVEGPLGFPVKESVARALEGLLKEQPGDSAYEYRRVARAADVDIEGGSRTDVSTITTDDRDRAGEVVLPKRMDARHYGRVVTLAHDYSAPFGAANLWMKPRAAAWSPRPSTSRSRRTGGMASPGCHPWSCT